MADTQTPVSAATPAATSTTSTTTPESTTTSTATADTSTANSGSSHVAAGSTDKFTERDLLEAAAELDGANTVTANTTTANTATANTETANTSANTAATDTDEKWDPKDGPEPSRYQKTLTNARAKERATVTAEYNAKYGITEDAHPDDVKAAITWMKLGNENPLAAADKVVQNIVRHAPQAIPQVREWALNLLGISQEQFASLKGTANTATAQPTGNTAPATKIVAGSVKTDTGSGVYTDAEINALLAQQKDELLAAVRAELGNEIKPLKSEHEARAQAVEQQRVKDAIAQDTTVAHDKLKGLPGFEANKDAIYTAAMKNIDGQRSAYELLSDAYHTIVGPKLAEIAQQEAVKHLEKKASAGTFSPQGAQTSAGFDYDKATWAEVLEHETRLAGGIK